ncbi:MAG: hypothetical protein PHC64_03300 [Candidatus Gastranaerophilales bacterium]|nr:hypothetical protein [Candidatus Gastranaerophilales bacterium]
MKTYFYNLSGGINQAASKTALGLDTKKLYWADAKNVEILQNSGVIRQKGNTLLLSLAAEEEIISIHQLKDGTAYNLIIATASGNLYIYGSKSQTLTKLTKTIDGSARINFVDFLDGVVAGSKEDALFYINNDEGYPTESCNLNDFESNPIKADIIHVFAGRVWVASGATLYYSALGTYNDFTTENNAGYINNFYTDTNDITALKTYKDYLAIYKEDSVYLLSGSSYEDFKITPFADKGTTSFSSVVTVNNRQYFINQGVFSMEQAGLLSQIQLGEEISLKIKSEFNNFDKTRFDEIIVLHYETKNQVWYFIPYQNDDYFHTIWIYSYIDEAWFKRILPQNITTACVYDKYILTADSLGKVYIEDFGSTFNGETIEFMWKSPFLAAGDSNVRKTIEEFYFILDEAYDNNFNFSVYKNYDDTYRDDEDTVYSINSDNLIWYGDNISSSLNCSWNYDSSNGSGEAVYSLWAIGSNSVCKADISESNYSVQLCVEGTSAQQNAAIIGLEFKEVYLDE